MAQSHKVPAPRRSKPRRRGTLLFILRGSLLAWSVGVILSAAGRGLGRLLDAVWPRWARFRAEGALLTAVLEATAVVLLTSPALERALGRSATAEHRSIGSI